MRIAGKSQAHASAHSRWAVLTETPSCPHRPPGICSGRGPPAFARVPSGRGGLISRRAREAMMGPTVIEAPLDASSAPDSAAASSVRLCAQPIQSPLTGGGQAAASEPGEPESEPGEPEPEYGQKSAANQSAGRGGQSKPQLSGGGCPRARRRNTAFCVACFPYSIDSGRNIGAQRRANLSVLLSMRSLGHIIYMSHDSPIHNN